MMGLINIDNVIFFGLPLGGRSVPTPYRVPGLWHLEVIFRNQVPHVDIHWDRMGHRMGAT